MICPPVVAVLDTCAIFGELRRDILLTLAESGAFECVLSEFILAELRESLQRFFIRSGVPESIAKDKVDRLCFAVRSAFPENVLSLPASYRSSNVLLPDAGDAHVVALAEKAGAGFIVTENLRDFPAECLPAGCVAVSTDDFVRMLFLRDSAGVFAAVERIAARSGRKGPQYSVAGLLDVYARILPEFGRELL